MYQHLSETVGRIVPEMTALRHELHQHPEIRFEERWTSDRIARFLDDNGVPYKRGFAGGTGIVATLKGDGPRTVLLRADMDALEIQEETGLPYASRIPQRMHACGHDGHMACLCGTLKTLLEHRHDVKGTVRFVFQPGEELAGAAELMVQEGVADGVDAAFALHGWPSLPVGAVGVKPGWFMSSADSFTIEVEGKGCHGAEPAAGVDPVIAAAHIATALQTLVSRETDPRDPCVVTVARINAGISSNIIPETAEMEGTIRSFSGEVHARLREGIKRVAEHTAAALRARAAVRFPKKPYPAMRNDATMTALLRETAFAALGSDNVVEFERPHMVAEDFAFFLEKAPGSYFCLGVNPHPETPYPSLHNPRYDFTDAALPVGITMMSSVALRFLAQK